MYALVDFIKVPSSNCRPELRFLRKIAVFPGLRSYKKEFAFNFFEFSFGILKLTPRYPIPNEANIYS
jgi:hypothetical protein